MKKWENPELKNLSLVDTKENGCEYVATTYNPIPGAGIDKCKHYKDGYCYHPNYGVGDNNGSSAVEHWPCPQGIKIS